MAELTCRFATVVYAELYRLLAERPDLADPLAFRLDEIQLRDDWLQEAADTYDAKWRADLEYMTPATVDDYLLSQGDHAVLATWILAGLRNSGRCHDLAMQLEERVQSRVYCELPGISAPLPAVLSPVIYGWTLGSMIGTEELPVMPAILPSEENVREAFLGFVEHVLILQSMETPWPEMMSTATYWRGYGLAEGLRPDLGGGGKALQHLQNDAARSMAPRMFAEVSNHFKVFSQRRHAVSHVAVDTSRPSFIEVSETLRDWPSLRVAVIGLTQFVFQEVSKELMEENPRAIRAGVWETLSHDLATW